MSFCRALLLNISSLLLHFVIRLLVDLLHSGVDINARDADGWTALHAAAYWRQTEAVEILCDNMADMDAVNCVVRL